MANSNRAQHAAEAREANELEEARARAAAQSAGLAASPPGSDPDGQAALHAAEHELLAAHGMTEADAAAARLRAEREAANADADAIVRQVHEDRAARRQAAPAPVPAQDRSGVAYFTHADGSAGEMPSIDYERAHPVASMVHDPAYRARLGLDQPAPAKRRRTKKEAGSATPTG